MSTLTDKVSVRLKSSGNALLVEASVNGIAGAFLLDTGASFVSITKTFANKAKIPVNAESQVMLQSANGLTSGLLATANVINVGDAYAAYVPVVISDDTKLVRANDPDNVVGLLGMSFLSKFEITIAKNVLDLREKKY
jgi:aspartyl protease family protein